MIQDVLLKESLTSQLTSLSLSPFLLRHLDQSLVQRSCETIEAKPGLEIFSTVGKPFICDLELIFWDPLITTDNCTRRAHSTWGCKIRQKQYLLKYQFQSKTLDYCKFSPTSSIKHAPADQGTRLGSLFLRKIVRVPDSALSLQDSAGDCSVGLINQASRQSRTATQIETGQLP